MSVVTEVRVVSLEEGVRGSEELARREEEGNFQGLGNVLSLVLMVSSGWINECAQLSRH